MQPDEGPKKSPHAKIWEYAVKIVVSKGDIQEHEGISILQCWGEAEQLQDTNEAKTAKFKKLLSMKFGPKANHMLELITKAKEKVHHMVQQKQQMKQQQQGNSQDQSLGSGNGNASSQETLPMSQLSSVSPSPTMFNGPPPLSQPQPQYMQMNMGQYAPHQPQGQPQQPQFTGYGAGGALSVPVGMTGGGYVPPQQQGPPLLTPISQMAGAQGNVHASNSLPNMHHGNVPGIHSGGGAGLSIPSNHLLGGAPGISGHGNPTGPNMGGPVGQGGSAMIFNNHPGYPPRPMAPNFTQGALNSNPMANMMAQGMAKKGPAGAAAGNKRSAGAAGMDADAKGGKKKAPPQMGQPGQFRPGMAPGPGQQPFGPGLLSGGPGTGPGGPNRPLNTPGGANFFYNNPQAASAGPGGVGQPGPNAPAEPLTVAQELEAMTEKPNSVAEGLEPVGEGTVAAPLITPDFIRQENESARMRAAAGFRPGMVPGPGQGAGQSSTAASMMQRLNIPGVPNIPIDPEHVWQCANIVDKSMMGRAAMKVLEGTELKLGGACLSLLSNGIQLHLKNVLESAYRLSRSRQNHTAISSYASISRMIVEHGKGRALAPMLQNVGMRWGDDVRGVLSAEEAQARRLLRQYDTALEEVLQNKMRAADEERQKTAGNKRRPGTDDAAWWTKEDAAEKSGLLGWADLAHVSFKQSIARKHDLGTFATTSRNARSKNSAAAAQAAAAAAQASAEQGRGADAEATAAAAEATLRALTAPQVTSPVLSNHGSQDSVHGSNPELASHTGESSANGAASASGPNSNGTPPDWMRQPCPLHLTQRTGKIVIQEEDLAITLERSTHNRGLPGGVLSGVRPTGSCLYKHKMGVYAATVAAAAAAANAANGGST